MPFKLSQPTLYAVIRAGSFLRYAVHMLSLCGYHDLYDVNYKEYYLRLILGSWLHCQFCQRTRLFEQM